MAAERAAPELPTWPEERADEALEALARHSGLARGPAGRHGPAAGDDRPAAGAAAGGREGEVGRWIEDLAGRLGLEAEETEVSYGAAGHLVRGCGPALLRLPGPSGASSEGPGLLAVLGSRRDRVRVLAPDLRVRSLALAEVARALRRDVERPVLPAVEKLLERTGVPRRRAGRARSALLQERLRRARIGGCWLLRLPPGAGFWRQLRHRGLGRELLKFLVYYGLSYGMLLLSWWLLGRGALGGLLSRDWLLAWALILISLILPRQLTLWAQAKVAVGGGTLLKRRLLAGALKLDPDEIRHQGAGQLLGRVIESEAIETHLLLGGSLAIVSVLELALSAWVLGHGAGGWLQVLLLAAWTAGVLAFGWRYLESRLRRTDERLAMTHDLVESMVGHRTRLAQEGRGRWHRREDRLLDSYLAAAERMDRHRIPMAVAPHVWMLVGICGLLPAFVAARASVGSLALAVGGVLLAYRALAKLARGAGFLIGAWISWREAAQLFHAARRSQEVAARGVPATGTVRRDGEGGGPAAPFLDARKVDYRYRQRTRPVFEGLDLAIRRGDRLLLEGPSGGGKSTLAAILTRLRAPASGLLLLGGLDRYSVEPEVWRRHVVSAPQFHENHVFTETFAFNLLLGRRWPPARGDMAEAEAVCRELGLGALLERMPAGLLQLVGETGWQLSHGEKSRLYMARALLQGAEVVILDESFAALDPENLNRCLLSALKRAPTLLVIAHP